MPSYVCVTCGVQYAETALPPSHCAICEDERQYIGYQGQQWATLDDLHASHRNRLRDYEPGLTGIGTEPRFAIGQRALLVRASGGNVLWDCISLIDAETVHAVRALGGIHAVAVSHPHFYASMVEWSRAFDGVPIYLHTADRSWVMRPDPCIIYWEGATRQIHDGLTLVRCGGHFEGGTVLHWAQGAGGRGALLSGDTIQVVGDRRCVSFMRSYPNLIPLPASVIRQIVAAVDGFAFDRIYGGWWDSIVVAGGKRAIHRSAERYIRSIAG